MVFAKRAPTQKLDLLHQEKSASLVAFKLATDVSNVNLDLQSRYQIEALTTRNYPQYKPPIDKTGNILALTYNEIPRAREVAVDFNHFRGSVTVSHDLLMPVLVDVIMVIIYKDSFLQFTNDYQFKNRDML